MKDLKEVIYKGHVMPGYYINECSELFTTRVSGTMGINQHTRNRLSLHAHCYAQPLRQITGVKYKTGKILYRLKTRYTHYEQYNIPGNEVGIHAHRLVMETYNPFYNNIPTDLQPYWDSLPSIVQEYIYNGMTVDHINPDKSRPDYNYLSNLQWLTHRENIGKSDKVLYDFSTVAEKVVEKPVEKECIKKHGVSVLSFI